MTKPEPLSHPVGVLYEIRWLEICPWLILVKALRVSLLLRVLALATVGLIFTEAGWGVLDGLFGRKLATAELSEAEQALLELSLPPEALDHLFRSRPYPMGSFVGGWYWLTQPFLRLSDQELTWIESLGIACYGLWTILVWALFGGAIARTTAMYLSRGQFVGPLQAVRDAGSVWLSTTGAPLVSLLFAVGLAVPLVLLGTLIRLDFVAVLAGLVWGLMLAWGFVLACFLLGLFVGWPFMWGCTSVERSDAFDAVSRCFAYVYQRPLQLVFFVFVATVLGFLGEAVVSYFVAATTSVTEWTLSWGMGSQRTAALLTNDWQDSAAPFAARAINLWKLALTSVQTAYPLACLWTMSVGIYLLMRRQIDATEMEEIKLSDGTLAGGLPDLQTEAAAAEETENTPTTDQ